MGAGCSPGRDSSPRRCRQTQQHSAEDRLSTTQTCARRLADSRRRLRDHHRTTPAPASPSEGLRPPQTPHHVVAALNRDHQRRLPRGVPVPQPDPDQAARRPVREPDTPTDVRVPERQGPGSATSTSSTCSTCSLPTEPNSNTPLTTEGVSRQGWTRLGHDRLCWSLQTTEARKGGPARSTTPWRPGRITLSDLFHRDVLPVSMGFEQVRPNDLGRYPATGAGRRGCPDQVAADRAIGVVSDITGLAMPGCAGRRPRSRRRARRS